MMHHGRGIIYVTLTDERIRELGIPMVSAENSLLSGLLSGASFSVNLPGVHGVSAQGRAHTIRAAISDETKHGELVVPGHVQPFKLAAAECWRARGAPMRRWIWRAWRALNRPA